MNFDNIVKILLIVVVAGLLGGGMSGFMLALLILPVYYIPEESVIFSSFIFLFFIPSICLNLWKKNWGLILRRVVFAVFVGLFFTAMFALEQDSIPFNAFDLKVIVICLTLTVIPLTSYIIISTYFSNSRLYQEIEHIIRGMQLFGILPENEKPEDK